MGLFEDTVINVRSVANAVGKKAGKIADISKLKINAADLENEINKRFESLGRITYDAKKTGNDDEELVEECIHGIDELYEQLDSVNNQLTAAQNKVVCPLCGNENVTGSAFCSKCGTKLGE